MAERAQQDDLETSTHPPYVSIYCNSSEKEQWASEAEDAGYRSRSTYLYELIQESRRYRQQGFLSREQKQVEIQRLQSKIEQLEAELANEANQDRTLIESLENPELTKRVLSNRYHPLSDIVDSLLNLDVITADAREPVERALLRLAQRDEAEYRRGHGWRLKESG